MCKFLNGSDTNPLSKWFFDSIVSALPGGFVHSCPYNGEVRLVNITIADVPQVMQFMHGTYRTILRIFDSKDENIITARHEADIS